MFLVLVEDDMNQSSTNKIDNGMESKSMDSINSYGNGIDDTEEGDDIEKARLISQVLELQNTLDDLNQRVDGVKEENLRLRSENLVLGQYIGIERNNFINYFYSNNIFFPKFIENLMSASSVFSTTSPNSIASTKKK